jgi:hypothetical protein
MTKIKKLEKVVDDFEKQSEKLREECSFARKHNFHLEAQMLHEKQRLIEDICRVIRLKVLEELIDI